MKYRALASSSRANGFSPTPTSVNYASQVQIQANQAGDKLAATVVAVDPGIDLAVLKLDDETFFDTHAPLARAKSLPQIKDAVMVYGYLPAARAFPSPKALSRASSLPLTIFRFPVCASRLTPRSTRATAAGRRWRATK